MINTAVRTVRVRFPDSPVPDLVLLAQFRYAAEDPFAVCLAFPAEAGPIEWYFDRGLLTAGISGPAGIGDVTVRPGPDRTVLVTLRSRDDQAHVSIRAADVAAFLHDTYTLVPASQEAAHLDLDADINRLFD